MAHPVSAGPAAERKVALITGGSAGFGRAVARRLVADGWSVILTARGIDRLRSVQRELGEQATAIAGDVADERHRADVGAAIAAAGRLDLLVNNASALGPSPLPVLEHYPLDAFTQVLQTNVVAPLAFLQLCLPYLRASRGIAVQISSDAAVGGYQGWGGYGSSKAALDQLSNVAGAENPDVAIYALDPGDMRTEMHQAAFPGEDISDRPEPSVAVPALIHLLEYRPPSGRYIGSQLLEQVQA
ncbi:SDR family oxidoreductase [Skermania sp. ID1734]|uniref:SDR family NAD(P)-dependent oxidoreductase n=1 Tax=Skermania sp. ID1734 TaxID=2597516 RepID=UPI00117D8EF8|nr:SDR family NAD(P)-dependent oxidoreductase [Skermania sp. ID1734]TSE01010.1 SDR family oxidoreductase [Skermania sp. ID1734]